MPQYGYKISGLSRGDKFDEAECFLDRRLKDFEKTGTVFSEDGSRTQGYKRKNPDGTETEVTLIKNVTESGILVFSDIPLGYFKFGGWVLYLRDIVPTLIFAAIYWIGYTKLMSLTSVRSDMLKQFLFGIAGGMLSAFIGAVTRKLLVKNRSPLRVRFIQLGGAASLIMVLYYLTKPFSILSARRLFALYLKTPLLVLFSSAMIQLWVWGRSRKIR